MKTEKLVEQRIEKHLDLVENNKKQYTETEVLPATIDINGEEKWNGIYIVGALNNDSITLTRATDFNEDGDILDVFESK